MTTDKQRIAAKKWWNDNRDDFVNGFTGSGLATRSEYDIPAMLAAYAAHSEQGWVSVEAASKVVCEYCRDGVPMSHEDDLKLNHHNIGTLEELDYRWCNAAPIRRLIPPVQPESAQQIEKGNK